jgi:hypothetical protein
MPGSFMAPQSRSTVMSEARRNEITGFAQQRHMALRAAPEDEKVVQD